MLTPLQQEQLRLECNIPSVTKAQTGKTHIQASLRVYSVQSRQQVDRGYLAENKKKQKTMNAPLYPCWLSAYSVLFTSEATEDKSFVRQFVLIQLRHKKERNANPSEAAFSSFIG